MFFPERIFRFPGIRYTVSVRAEKRLSPEVIEYLRREIAEAGGNEVYAFGWLDDAGMTARARVEARGNEGEVLALPERQEAGDDAPDVLIHNHPSGFLVPSDNDLVIAGRAAEAGTGSFIIDNGVNNIYAVAEPVRRKTFKKLDPDRICAALEEGGAVARRLPAYEPRESQLALVRLAARGFNEDALVAAEAGTGVGKSFAYLLPSLRWALDNGERIVISTATINLQQQLFDKDIPLVLAALGQGAKKLKAVLVKGRGNYLCRRRLSDALRENSPALLPDRDQDEEYEALRAISDWAETSVTGSRAEIPFLPRESLWSRVCSEGDLCMGMRCPERERCFFFALRKACSDARILVVNHHLLFADLAARSRGAGYEGTVVLPPYTRIILDEAHTIEDSATSFFSGQFSRPGMFRVFSRLYRRQRAKETGLLLRLAALLPPDKGAEALARKAGKQITALRDLYEQLDGAAVSLCGGEGSFRLAGGKAREAAALLPLAAGFRKQLSAAAETVRDMLEYAPSETEDDAVVREIKSLLRRLDAVGAVCSAFLEYKERGEEVIWLECHRGGGDAAAEQYAREWAEFHVTPLNIGPRLAEALWKPNLTVICVSATLAVNGHFDHWLRRSGLDAALDRDVLRGVFPSPFPYASRVLLAVPSDAPLPEEPAFRPFVDGAVGELAASAGGSALALFTSYDALRSAFAAARPFLEAQGIRCLKQGDDDRARLLKTFLDDESSVLFATHSFWEGIDAPGDTLRLVILCRLPFKSPQDPVFEARCEEVERRGGNAFMDLSLPESVIKFKQGFGRLMRRSGDYGVVAVLDGRILHKRYGEFFLRSIPQTKSSFAEFRSVLRDTERFLFSKK